METTALVLGLDIGVASVGWALVDLQARQIQAAGVRIFDAAMDSVKFEAGDQGASHAATRRAARLQRRHLRRRAARHRDLYLALQGTGLLPFAGLKAENRHEILTKFDRELMENWRPRILEQTPDIIEPDQILCYYLRARALDHKLQPCELGRAIYHLGQRRGFKSNRREGRATVTASAPASSEQEHSEIKTSINTLAEKLNADHLTLGQYLTRVNPHTSAIRNRKRPDIPPIWTGRAMYQEEFNRIWAAQAHYHPGILTEALRNSLNRLLFWQRGISAGKPGHCELEPNLERAPKSSLLAQQFRMVQAVNNLKVCERGGIERKLRADERRVLTAILGTVITELKGKKRKSELFGLRFSTVKQSLGLHAHAKLNLDDEQADSYLRGNRTKAVMVRAFGQERWDALDDSQQRRIVRRWIKEQSPEKLLAIAGAVWKLEPHAAARLAETEPEEGYAALSHVAILKLLPAMEQEGLTYSEAVAKVYGNIFSGQTPKPFLPPVSKALAHVPNPAVMRALTEMKKVLNAVIRAYGKPAQIRIELARSLKRNAEQREQDWKANRNRQRERRWAANVLADLNRRPSRDAIDRVLLFRECTNVCVYCGQSLGGGKEAYTDLFSDSSAIEVEHILPRRCLDDSFSNKVLAHRTCNLRKGDRTPFQAFGTDPEWEQMLVRVEALGSKGKLDRFKIAGEQEIQEFSNRHLADTRYATKLATEYVEQIYGGRDASVPWQDRNLRCVYASSGTLTSMLRRGWGLEAILKEPNSAGNGQGGKPRTDHRHHAIDAIVIALTTQAMVQEAANHAQKHDRTRGHLLPRYFSPPWPVRGEIEDRVKIFKDSIRQVVETINVSHRPERKLNGPLHKATYYSPKASPEHTAVFTRTAVQNLSVADIESPDTIADPTVREAIRTELRNVGADPKKLEASLPHLETRRGRVPIRYVRIRVPGVKAVPVRKGTDQPSVFTDGNHHVSLFQLDDPEKGHVWYTPGPPVTRMEAMRRKADPNHPEVVRTSDGKNSTFVFNLMQGDTVEMLDKINGRKDLYIVASLSHNDYAFLRHTKTVPSPKTLGLTRAKLLKNMQDGGDRVRIRNVDELRVRDCRKVEVDPLGNVHYTANPRSGLCTEAAR